MPPVFSLVTGKVNYNEYNVREILIEWIDHPQRLWDAVYETLASGIETVIHVGPSPNLIPATFNRLRENVQAQLTGNSLNSLGLRAMARAVRRPWLTALLAVAHGLVASAGRRAHHSRRLAAGTGSEITARGPTAARAPLAA